MMMAATMSQKMGWLDPEEPGRIRELLGRANLPVKVPDGMSALDFLKHMAVDKKVSHGRIRLVLLKEIGDAILISDYPDGMLDEVLAEFTG